MVKILGSMALILAFMACKGNKSISIQGQIQHAKDIKYAWLIQNEQVIDSAALNEKGEFNLMHTGPTDKPDFFILTIGAKSVSLIAKNGDKISFRTNLNDTTSAYSIEGSEDSKKIWEFNKIASSYIKIYQKLKKEFQNQLALHPQNKHALEAEFSARWNEHVNAFSKTAISFAKKNQRSLASLYAISFINPTDYEPELIQYAEHIKSKYPDNASVQAFVSRTLERKSVAIEQKAPDFSASTPNGSIVKLSDLKGKYVVLNFWASWCGPCRSENPSLVKLYHRFKGGKFEILSVSLDNQKQAWVQAIRNDHLTWKHISELKQWMGEISQRYHVETIPSFFLIDPEGFIIAKTHSIVDLEKALMKHHIKN